MEALLSAKCPTILARYCNDSIHKGILFASKGQLQNSGLICEAKRKRSAFTLIELLVSITIVAVLASLLLTVVAEAKTQARLTLCKNNLRQLAQVLQMYAADNGAFPTGMSTWMDDG